MSAVLLVRHAAIDRREAASVALWVFIGVACALFGLFFAAYVMRLESAEGFPLDLPWQFWLSTALLLGASLALEAAQRAENGRRWLLLAGLAALAFVAVQLLAWSALLAARVVPAGNPAASFLYLLTAMHGLHVLVHVGHLVRTQRFDGGGLGGLLDHLGRCACIGWMVILVLVGVLCQGAQ